MNHQLKPNISMPPITARYHWTAEDLLIGSEFVNRSRRIRLIFFFSMCGAIYSSVFFRGKYDWSAVLCTAAILLLAIVVALPLGKFIAKQITLRQFAKRPDANAEVEWIFTEHGISTFSSVHKSEIQWSTFQRIISSSAGFLFMPNLQIFHFIPARAFETPVDIENLKILARRYASDFKELK